MCGLIKWYVHSMARTSVVIVLISGRDSILTASWVARDALQVLIAYCDIHICSLDIFFIFFKKEPGCCG